MKESNIIITCINIFKYVVHLKVTNIVTQLLIIMIRHIDVCIITDYTSTQSNPTLNINFLN